MLDVIEQNLRRWGSMCLGARDLLTTEFADNSRVSVVAGQVSSCRWFDVQIAVPRRPQRNPQIAGET